MKKCKICIVSLRSLPLYDAGYNSENVIGGAEINLYNLAVCLSQRENVSVQVLVDDFGQPERYQAGNIELLRFSKQNSNQSWFKRKLTKLLAYGKLLCMDADAFIFTTSNSLLGILVLFQKIIRRKKVIFRLSSDLNMDLEHYKKNHKALDFFLYKFGLVHATQLVAQTMKQKLHLKAKLGLNSVLIENGFFINSSIRAEDKRHILWVGRCIESKHPLLFLELARSLPQETFIMIMPMNKEIPEAERIVVRDLSEKVHRTADALSNVKMMDYVPYQEIQDYFDRAKAYVCTSDLEGFPNTFIQACLGGTPILSYNVNPSGMLEEYTLGCFCDNDEKKAVEFIRSLSQKMLNRYIPYLQHYVKLKHDIYEKTEKYLSILDFNFKQEASDDQEERNDRKTRLIKKSV